VPILARILVDVAGSVRTVAAQLAEAPMVGDTLELSDGTRLVVRSVAANADEAVRVHAIPAGD
jgi:hypothetical protein